MKASPWFTGMCVALNAREGGRQAGEGVFGERTKERAAGDQGQPQRAISRGSRAAHRAILASTRLSTPVGSSELCMKVPSLVRTSCWGSSFSPWEREAHSEGRKATAEWAGGV